MKIVNMKTLNKTQLTQAVQMLTDELPLGWPTLADAEQEVRGRLNPCGTPDCLWRYEGESAFLAAVESGQVVGWGGILPAYGRVCELHPLVVRRDRQGKGVGTMLIGALEDFARAP